MKDYSDVTKKLYDSEKECKEAEELLIKAKAEEEAQKLEKTKARKARAEAIDQSYEKLQEAQKEYSKLVAEFVRDYGSYHKTYSHRDDDSLDFDSLFSVLFS